MPTKQVDAIYEGFIPKAEVHETLKSFNSFPPISQEKEGTSEKLVPFFGNSYLNRQKVKDQGRSALDDHLALGQVPNETDALIP